jgi:hypothetical protein
MTRLHRAGAGRRDRAIRGLTTIFLVGNRSIAFATRLGLTWGRPMAKGGLKGELISGGINIYTPYYFNSPRCRIDFEVFPLALWPRYLP